MSVEKNCNSDRQKRAKRVKVLKKIILILLVIAIVIPTVLCIVLFARIHSLEKQVQRLYETKALEQEQIQVQKEAEQVAAEAAIEGKQLELEEETGQPETEDTRKKVYLTFDDGPSANTTEILDILQKYHVKATFFVVGKTDEVSRENYKRIVAEGHTLGMHSYSHRYDEIYTSKEAYAEDLCKLQDYLYEITGVRSTYVRFPGGSSNKVSKVNMQDLISYLNEKGITYYDWNISCGDADTSNLDSQTIVSNCLDKLDQYRNEAMILMHDANDKKTTIEALPVIIESIQKMDDAVILPITEETIPIQHVIEK